MFSRPLICTWLLMVAPTVYGAPRPLQQRQSNCPTVHIIATRGTFEPDTTTPGSVPDVEGFIGTLSNAIKARVPGSDSNGTLYPANASPYNVSEAAGVGNLTQGIQDYVAKCPDTPIVLTGYSQGAQVVANTICGTLDNSASPGPFANTTALDYAAYGSHIKAVVTWGNPTHMPNQSYNKGDALDKIGIFGRLNVEDCLPYAPVWADFCLEGDLVCERNGSNPLVHLLYPTVDVDASTNFALELLAADGVYVSPASSTSSSLFPPATSSSSLL